MFVQWNKPEHGMLSSSDGRYLILRLRCEGERLYHAYRRGDNEWEWLRAWDTADQSKAACQTDMDAEGENVSS